MAFGKTVTVTGDQNTYEISPKIKKYALMDVGFQKTKTGNFSLERNLDPTSPYQANSPKVKIMVNQDLTGFKLAVTTANGLQSMNIFSDPKKAGMVQQYEYIIKNLIDRDILIVK